MTAFPLAHISWALADNDTRKACDAFLTDVFGAQTAFEVLLPPAVQAMGLDREETLMVVGNTMLISIAPVGPGERPESVIGTMLRHHARPGCGSASHSASQIWTPPGFGRARGVLRQNPMQVWRDATSYSIAEVRWAYVWSS